MRAEKMSALNGQCLVSDGTVHICNDKHDTLRQSTEGAMLSQSVVPSPTRRSNSCLQYALSCTCFADNFEGSLFLPSQRSSISQLLLLLLHVQSCFASMIDHVFTKQLFRIPYVVLDFFSFLPMYRSVFG